MLPTRILIPTYGHPDDLQLYNFHMLQIKDGVCKREHCSLAPASAAASVAEDAERRTLFQLHTIKLPSQKASSGRDDQTQCLGGECTIFSLHFNTHKQSLTKGNTCMHNLVPCVHTHTYIGMCRHQQQSAPLLFLIRKICAKRAECLQTLGLLPAWQFVFISCSYKNQKT